MKSVAVTNDESIGSGPGRTGPGISGAQVNGALLKITEDSIRTLKCQ